MVLISGDSRPNLRRPGVKYIYLRKTLLSMSRTPSERYGIRVKGLRSYFIVEFSYCRQAKNLSATEPEILQGVKANGSLTRCVKRHHGQLRRCLAVHSHPEASQPLNIVLVWWGQLVTSPLWAQELSLEHSLEIATTYTDGQQASFLPKRVSEFYLPVVAIIAQPLLACFYPSILDLETGNTACRKRRRFKSLITAHDRNNMAKIWLGSEGQDMTSEVSSRVPLCVSEVSAPAAFELTTVCFKFHYTSTTLMKMNRRKMLEWNHKSRILCIFSLSALDFSLPTTRSWFIRKSPGIYCQVTFPKTAMVKNRLQHIMLLF